MDVVRVVVINFSDLDDRDVSEGVDALQRQVSDDFEPKWKRQAELTAVGKNERKRLPGHWAVILVDEDHPPTGTATPWSGYRDLTREGLPLARIDINRVAEGQDWTHAASRALLNMLADPDCSATAYDHPDSGSLRFYARDVCDPVAAYEDGYLCGRRQVADFTHPAYWEPRGRILAPEATFDERRRVRGPFEVRPGGSLGVFDCAAGAWRLVGQDGAACGLPEAGSRLELRNTARNRWAPSGWVPDEWVATLKVAAFENAGGDTGPICPP